MIIKTIEELIWFQIVNFKKHNEWYFLKLFLLNYFKFKFYSLLDSIKIDLNHFLWTTMIKLIINIFLFYFFWKNRKRNTFKLEILFTILNLKLILFIILLLSEEDKINKLKK